MTINAIVGWPGAAAAPVAVIAIIKSADSSLSEMMDSLKFFHLFCRIFSRWIDVDRAIHKITVKAYLTTVITITRP